jgi:tetratricopeptide (TPR) repeat protein
MNSYKYMFFLSFFFSFSVFSQTADEHYKKGEQQIKMGDYNDAIEHYTNAIKADSAHNQSYLRRAFCFNATGKFLESINDYNIILANDPKNVFALNSRGGCYNKLERYAEAMEDFNAVLAIDKSNIQAINNRGWAKKGLGNMKAACEDWNKAKQLGSDEAKIILKNNNCK